MSEDVEILRRQVANLIRLATVTEIDHDLARVKVGFMDNTTGWIAWTTPRAGAVRSWSPPSIGEQVIMLCPNGATEQAFCLPALYKNDCPPPSNDNHAHLTRYADDAVIGYNDSLHTLSVALPESATVTIASDGGLSVTGDLSIIGSLSVSGDLSASGNVSDGTRSIADDRGIFNGHTHTGNMGNPTSAPAEKQ